MLIAALVMSTAVLAAPAADNVSPEALARMIHVTAPDVRKLDPELSVALPAMVAAALESSGGYTVLPAARDAGWSVELALSGKGPWKLSARALPVGAGVEGGRVSTDRIGFNGRDDLPRAVDELVSQLDAGWRKKGSGAGSAEAPVHLSEALTTSVPALYDFLAGRSAIVSRDASGAAGLLDRALAADPSFVMAAVERARLHLASMEDERARAVLAAVLRSTGPATARARAILETMSSIAERQGAGALEKSEAIAAAAPRSVSARTLRALALDTLGRHTESLEEWRRIAEAEPADAAVRALLGRALMAVGQFEPAAAELERARAAWPTNLILYTLHAECLARLRDTEGARHAILAMKEEAERQAVIPDAEALNPYLLLGSVDLLEGRFSAALQKFEDAADMKSKTGDPAGPQGTLLRTIVEMRRDLVAGTDELARSRQIEDSRKALDRYESSLSAEERGARGMELLRLRGLIMIKEGDTVGAWKLVEQMRQEKGRPGFSAYDEAYLSAAAATKEGDSDGALAHFERAAASRGELVDYMDLGQTQLVLRRYPEARASLERIERSLSSYAPADTGEPAAGDEPSHGDLILADPHVAAMVPIYQYVRARLAYETGNGAESRRYFNRMLKYLQAPDEIFSVMVSEAVARGAYPE